MMHLPRACLLPKKSEIFCIHSESLLALRVESGFEPKPGLVLIAGFLPYTASLIQVKR